MPSAPALHSANNTIGPSSRKARTHRDLSAIGAWLLLCVACGISSAQSYPDPGVIQSFSAIEPHEYDSINLATLAIQLNAPVRSKAGHTPLSFSLVGAARVRISLLAGQSGPVEYLNGLPSLVGQETHIGQWVASGVSASITVPCGSSTRYGGLLYTDPLGNPHPFSIPGTTYLSPDSSCAPTSGAGYTTDGSGYYIDITDYPTGTALAPDGQKVSFSGNSATSVTDLNGHSISFVRTFNGSTATSTYTDTLAQTAITQTVVYGGAPNETDAWTDALGTSRTVKLSGSLYTMLTSFGCPLDNTSATPNVPFPTTVTFPDIPTNSTLKLAWEKNYSNSSYYTGRLASLTLPTGGIITYGYSGGSHGINCVDATPATMTRTTPDGEWTYVHTPGTGTSTTQVTDPLGNNTVYTFQPFVAFQAGTSSQIDNLETEKKAYNGAVSSANLVQTVITCYNDTSSSPTSCSPSSTSLPITEKDVYTTYTGVSGYAAVKTAYDTYGRVTDVKTYDFGLVLINEKQIAYGTGSPTSQSCSALSNAIGKACSVTLLDSQNGNAISTQTWNAYDTDGNLTQMWNLVSGSGATGTYLWKKYTYSSGIVQTSTDVNGQVMNYTTTSCNSIFVTSQYPTNFTNLKTSQVWDCNGGLTTSETDANSQITKTDYFVSTTVDPFYRPIEKIDELGNITTFAYTPTSIDSSLPVNAGASVLETHSTLDTTGRAHVSQLRQGPSSSTWDTRSRSFDKAGRLYETSLPCATTVGSPCAASTESQTYDGLNRPLVHTGTGGDIVTKAYVGNDVLSTLTPAPSGENAKAVQKEYDGLGRLKSACLISSATGSTSCGQTNAKNGFLTTYTYDAAGRLLKSVENAKGATTQSRTYTYDKIGRILTETDPESKSGTSSYTYTYDTVSGTCASTSNGDLVQQVDANGNTACFHYDGLHRNTYIVYSGPNSSGVNKFFVYDSATVDGVAMTNAEGRLAEAYTCAGTTAPCSPKITDEGFSYDARGQMSNFYQTSPNSGGFYHLSVTRWEDGQVKTVSGVGLPTLTYGGLDGEARVQTVSASSGTNPVTGVTYYNSGTGEPIGALITTTLGTGDTQNFTYDVQTGRMKSYTATVGSPAVTIAGTLGWNANGTLGSLDISDGYNSANTQDCSYVYDDFIRVASVSCLNGSTKIWNQTFTYGTDSFGNVTKSTTGPGVSWNPGYNAATNHYTLTGTSYDSDGNLLADTFHTYTWLADGHVATIDSDTITYDAHGNKVEENVGGTVHEYVSAFGISAQMTGQTEAATDVDLPGGVQALYSGGALQRFRFPDWQGSIRAESTTARAFSESVAFAPFGERYALKGSPFNVDSFTGKPDQIVPDEYDFTAREEHNSQGRWISPDPVRGTGNKYVYANNNPLRYVDPYGLVSVVINGIDYGSLDAELVQSEFNRYTPESQPTTTSTVGARPTPGGEQKNNAAIMDSTTANQTKAQAEDADRKGQPEAQNTSAAAVAPVTTAPLVIDKIIVTVEAATEKAFDVSLGAIGGTIAFIFASSQEAGSPKELIFEHEQKEKQEEAQPAAAAGGAGKGVIPGHPFTGPNAAKDAFKHLQQFHGIDPNVASERLHQIKQRAGLGAADNAVIGRTGDVYNPYTGEHIGSLTSSH